jgi:protoporphyrinogen oxidase
MRFTPIGLADRLRLGLVSLYLRRVRDWRRFEDTTAAEWLPKWVGRPAYEAVWEPLLRGKFGKHYQDVGMTWLWGKIALRFASRATGMGREVLVYPMGSFGEVFDTLGERIRSLGGAVNTSAAVQRVVVEEGRATGLEVVLPGRESALERFDAIVATVPSTVLPRLTPQLPEEYLGRLTGVTYLAAVLIVLVLDRPLTDIYWLNIADRTVPFVAAIEHTNLIPPEHYGDRHIVYLSNYLGREDPMYGMGHDELLEVYRPHLRRLNPAFEDSWVLESYYHREDAAQPVIGTGYSKRVPAHRTPIPGLYLANTTQIFPEDRGTNYSVRLGRKVARMVLRDHGHPVSGELPSAALPNTVTSSDTWE